MRGKNYIVAFLKKTKNRAPVDPDIPSTYNNYKNNNVYTMYKQSLHLKIIKNSFKVNYEKYLGLN